MAVVTPMQGRVYSAANLALANELGAYTAGSVSGTMAAGLAADAAIISFRWGDTSRICAVERVILSAQVQGTAFATGAASFGLILARAFTASDSGGTAVTLTTNNAKRRTNMPTSLVTDFRFSSTAALTAGTRTLDAQDAVRVAVNPGTATTGQILAPTALWDAIGGLVHPLVLAQDEGFIVRATVPATGTWTFAFAVDWAELDRY